MAAKLTADEICRACGGRLAAGRPDLAALGVSTDTRSLGERQAFIALIGPHHDAHHYVSQAIAKGASIVVAQRRDDAWQFASHQALVLVDDTTRALVDLAAWHRKRLRGKVIAITGSCGKSTVKTMTSAILSRVGRCTSTPKSFNNRIGTSLALLEADPGDDFVVLEMGTNHPGEIDELAGIARPHAGLITCIGDCHLQGLRDRCGVMEAKAEMIPHLNPGGVLVLNADDPLCMELAARHPRVATFGRSAGAHVRPLGLRRDGQAQVFEVDGQAFRVPAPGRHNVLNAAAAICLSRWAGVPPQDAAAALAKVALPGLRSELRRIGEVDYTLDCYNANPTAFCAALLTFLQESEARRLIVVCGDMLELGSAAPSMHTLLGRALALTSVDTLVAVGPLGRYVIGGWREFADENRKAVHVPSPDEAPQAVRAHAAPGDAVLIKGSRAMQLERITETLAQETSLHQQEAVA